MKQNEKAIENSIRMLLGRLGILCWKHFPGPIGKKGISDILGCYKGRLIAIEVKVKGGKVSPYQEKFIEEVNQAGGLAFVAYCIDDVIEQLGLQDRFLFKHGG